MVSGPPCAGNEPVAAPLAFIFLAYRTLIHSAGVHVNQDAGIAFEMTDQQDLKGLGFFVPAIQGKIFGQNQVQVDMNQIAGLPSPELVDRVPSS